MSLAQFQPQLVWGYPHIWDCILFWSRLLIWGCLHIYGRLHIWGRKGAYKMNFRAYNGPLILFPVDGRKSGRPARNSDKRAYSVQLGWDLTELGKNYRIWLNLHSKLWIVWIWIWIVWELVLFIFYHIMTKILLF